MPVSVSFGLALPVMPLRALPVMPVSEGPALPVMPLRALPVIPASASVAVSAGLGTNALATKRWSARPLPSQPLRAVSAFNWPPAWL